MIKSDIQPEQPGYTFGKNQIEKKMKTQFIAVMALMTLALGACKKDKDVAPEPKRTVKTATLTLKNYDTEKDPSKAIVWFSVSDRSAHTMGEITADADLQKNISFGYNLNEIDWGLYSPGTYPHEYGQENWKNKNTTIFKKMSVSFDVFAKQAQSDPGSINEVFIIQQFQDGSGAEASVKNFPEGAVYVFETADGIKGIVRVSGMAKNLQTVDLKVWVLQ